MGAAEGSLAEAVDTGAAEGSLAEEADMGVAAVIVDGSGGAEGFLP